MSNQYADISGRPGQSASRGPPPMKSYYPGDLPDPRYRPRPPQQQQPPPLSAVESTAPLADDNAFAGAGAEQWPLPPQPIGQEPPRSNSPSGNGSRRPPQRPPRPDHQPPFTDHPRQHGRMMPGHGPYPRGPPPQRPPRGNAEWNDGGYMTSQQAYAPPSAYSRRPPPQRPMHPPGPDFSSSQQAMYHHHNQMPRPPPGGSPYGRRGPQAYYHQQGPVRPRGEDANRMGAGSRNENFPPDYGPIAPFTPPYANSIKYPSYYFEDPENNAAASATAAAENQYHDSPMEPQHPVNDVDSESEQRDVATPEPPALIREASLGKKSRPTLMNVKKRGSSEESATTISSRPQEAQASKEQLTPFVEEVEHMPGAWVSENPTPVDEANHEQPLEVGAAPVVAEAVAARAASPAAENSNDHVGNKRRSSDILVSPISVRDVSPYEPPSEPAKTLPNLGLVVSPLQEQQQLPGSRSPLAPSPRDTILSRRGLTPTSPVDSKSPMEGASDDSKNTNPNGLTVDIGAVKDAEKRGSLTSLPDLIRRATRLATNLDRGKTASRLGLNFFDWNGSSDALQKYQNAEKNRRSGSLSDMLGAFPTPGSRDSKAHFSSLLQRSQIPSDSDADELRRKPKRKYCGLSLWALVLLGVVLFLLIAAAIIVPVVLLVVPKQGNNSSNTPAPSNSALAHCQQQLTCHNGGLNIIGSGSSCGCLCVNGYTGTTCTTLSASGCTTVAAGPAKNATVGDSIPPLLSSAGSKFNIPLNGETLLGLFSKADLSCTSENALVKFNAATARPTRLSNRALLQSTPVDPSKRKGAGIDASKSESSVVDFASVAVLYIFQATSEIKSATTAQEKFQSYFTSRGTPTGDRFNAKNITLGNGFSCDLLDQSLVWNLSNGTTVAS